MNTNSVLLPKKRGALVDFNALRAEALELRQRADALLRCVQLNCVLMDHDSALSDIEVIQLMVAAEFHQDVGIMKSKVRNAEVAWPRQIAMYFARQLTSAKLQTVGGEFGGRDHGTVLYANAAVVDRCSVNPRVKLCVDDLCRKITLVLASSRRKKPKAREEGNRQGNDWQGNEANV